MEWLKEAQLVYNKITDDQSRSVFNRRMLFSLTRDYQNISQITEQKRNPYQELHDHLLDLSIKGQKLILDGAGIYGEIALGSFHNIPWTCICDRNPMKELVGNIPVISRKEAMEKYNDAIYVITSMLFYKEIEAELQDNGIKNIVNIGREVDRLQDLQYFNRKQYWDYLQFTNHEILADVGCENGATIFYYLQYASDDYETVYSFEPEPTQFKNCEKVIRESGRKNWEVHNYAIWDKSEMLSLLPSGPGSTVVPNGQISVKAISLDEFFAKRKKPTLIKMDIEGAEMHALQGVRNIISQYAPKLAISVYHKPEDIIEIPTYILSLNPNYKFGFRHYSEGAFETVMYAYV